MTNNVRFTFSVVTLHGRFRITLDTIVSVTHYLGLDNAIFGFLDINNFNYYKITLLINRYSTV